MAEYRTFAEYLEDNHLDEIVDKLKPYVISHKDSFESDEIYSVSWVELQDAFVMGVTYKDLGNDKLEIRTSIEASIEIKGKGKYGYDSFAETYYYNVFCTAILRNGLHDFTAGKVETYYPSEFDRKRSLSQDLVPYMYEEDVENHAEDFLKRNYPKALLQPMAIPVMEVVDKMDMEMYYAPLEEGVFGKTFFASEKVKVYTDITKKEIVEVITRPGTMLINPDVYFMYNIGTANNTIIHECVHWDRHRRPFELQKLLQGKCNYISCEIVEIYDGIPEDASAMKWMEWQANQLAPRILMPKGTTLKVYKEYLQRLHAEYPLKRNAELLEIAIGQMALYFGVSAIAVKIRLIELGIDEAQGACVYSNGRYLPPYSFPNGTLKANQTFVLDEQNAIIEIFMSEELRSLYFENKIVYANSMVCINSPKYITVSDYGEPILTIYALEHVHECCYVFTRKVNVGTRYTDSFYRRCFLCRDVNSETFIEAKYDPNHKNNQSKSQRKEEINKITESIADMVNRLANEIPGGFAGTLSYHMKRKNITNEELSGRTNISVPTISGYKNNADANITFERALALCNGLKLTYIYSEDLMRKANYDLSLPHIKNYMALWVLREHPDDTLEQWQEKFNEAHANITLPGFK